MNQDDQASEWQEKIEMTPELLAELQDKARQRGKLLFLAAFLLEPEQKPFPEG